MFLAIVRECYTQVPLQWTVKVGFLSGGISRFDTKLFTKYFQLHGKKNYIPH